MDKGTGKENNSTAAKMLPTKKGMEEKDEEDKEEGERREKGMMEIKEKEKDEH